MNERQKAIAACLKKYAVSDQQMLVELLKEWNISTNQVTISRDLRRMGVIKKSLQGKQIYEIPSPNTTHELLKMAVLNIEHNEQMIVVTTRQALAPFVGDYIDALEGVPLLGCIAGENVVFIAPRIIKNIQAVCDQLQEALFFKRS